MGQSSALHYYFIWITVLKNKIIWAVSFKSLIGLLKDVVLMILPAMLIIIYYKYLNKNTLFTREILFIEEYVEIKFNISHHSLSLLHKYITSKYPPANHPQLSFFPILEILQFYCVKKSYWTKCMKRFDSVLILALNEDLKVNIWR